MKNNEIPIDGEPENNQWTEHIPSPDNEDTLWGEELDEYLDYIDNLNPENKQATQETMDDWDDLKDLEPYVELGIYKQSESSKKYRSTGKIRVTTPIITILLILILGSIGFTIIHFTDIFNGDSKSKQQIASSEQPVTTNEPTTEEATTEDPYGPYATTDYTIHTPHVTEQTIVFDSNSYSLKYAGEAATTNSGEETTEEPTLEDLYPAITLTPVDGSLNATEPDPDNLAETQQLTSRYMVLVDLSDDSIVAKRDSDVIVNPASMTKILTVLTASDVIEDLDDTYVITQEEIQYAYSHDCSAVGFLEGETVTVRDLIYGTIVCSGGDAAVGLANYCYGSHEAFVEKMNEKVADLGISDTAHFTNVVGIYDENLHCTMEDMAVILATAVQNDLCREVLSTRIYTTTPDPSFLPDSEKSKESDTASTDETTGEQTDASTNDTADGETETSTDDSTEEETPESILLVATKGIEISNWFMRRIEDRQTGGEVLGAKTGFVNASGSCAASYFKSTSGKEYICVTGDTYSSWRCIFDHVSIYRSLTK